MPLKTPAQVSSLAEYKKLVLADAKALSATGAKFQSFTKFTFGDKTTSAVIFFGIVSPAVAETLKKQGTGPATGTASVNGNDDIELEVANGSVPYTALASSLKSLGVTRKLIIPLGAEDGAKDGAPPSTTPKIVPIRKPEGKVQPRPLPPRINPNPTQPNPNPNPNPTQPNVPKAAPLRQPRMPVPVSSGPGTVANPSKPQVSPTSPKLPTNRPLQKPGPTQPQGVPPKGPIGTGVKTGPTAQTGPGKQQGPVTPPMTPKRIFDGRLVDLKARYEIALKANPNVSFKALYQGMLQKAQKGDFAGALADAGKVDTAMSKAAFEETKAVKQQNRSAKLTESLDAVKRSYFKPGGADAIGKEKLDAGTTFKAFLKAQKAFETARDEKTLAAFEKAAKDYLAHFDKDYSEKDKKKKESIRKKAICETAIKGARHFQIALEKDKLGAPPWDEEKEMRAAEIYTKLLFEGDEKLATPNDPDGGVNGAFWIEKTTWDEKTAEKEEKRTFIFKPADAEAPVAGFPKGGSVAREMLGKAVGDVLQVSMGLDFAFPESTVVAVDSSKLPDEKGQPGPVGVPRAGSIQHFAKSKGELKKLAKKDPSILASIPDDEIQKMAVLDLVQLNMDRHSGNFMVAEKDGTSGKVPKLVPIDNGLCLPSRAGLRGRRAKIGPPHNALGDLPGAQKKMSPEMVEKIKQINPDEVVAAMKKSFEAMKKLHPEAAKSAEISDENFELTKRSILFMQKASTELTVAELQDAYVSSLEEIFDSAPDKMEAGFNQAIQNVKTRGPALKELAVMQKDPAAFEKEMRVLGWGIDVSKQAFDAWVRMNPARVVKIYKGKIENPVAVKKLADMREMLKDLPPEKTKPTGRGLEQEILTLGYLTMSKQNSRAKAFGIETPTQKDGEKVDIYEELGGAAKMKQLNLKGEVLTLDQQVEMMMKPAMAQYGGDTELAKIAKLYPDSPLKTPVQKYQSLKAWADYQKLGGDVMFYRLGGGVENLVITQRLKEIKCMMELEQVG